MLTSKKENEKFIEFLTSKITEEIMTQRKKIISTSEYSKDSLVSDLKNIKLPILFLNETGLYKDHFNEHFLSESKKFYNDNAIKLIETIELSSYVKLVEIIFQAENEIICAHLNEMSLKRMINSLNENLIKDRSKKIFEKLFKSKSGEIFNTQFELLKKIYLLFKKIKQEKEVKDVFDQYIKDTSASIYEKYSSSYLDLYNHFVQFKNNIDSMISISFLKDEKFKSLGKECLGKAINMKPNFIADYFSRYIDNVLTTQAKTLTESNIKNKIQEFMNLFKLLEAKDAFENFFIKKLANRCLYNLTASQECQSFLIEKLKDECGPFFVTKSEEMISDIKTSKNNSTIFNSKTKIPIEMNFYVLSVYSWPVTKMISGFVNTMISTQEKKFAEFYRGKNSGKSLTWHLPYSNCEMTFTNKKGEVYVLKGNGIHAAILGNFNKASKTVSLKEILASTKIEKADLMPYIEGILKNKILVEDNSKEVYTFNDKIDRAEKTITLIQLNMDETTVKEKEEVVEKTTEDRKYVIDAYIMKLLKPKKEMKFNELIQGVINAVKFKCEEEIVKQRINQLINNRFISKDEQNEEILKYFK